MSEVDAGTANGETSDSGAGAGAGDAGANGSGQNQGGQGQGSHDQGGKDQGSQDTTIIGGGGGDDQAGESEGEGEGGKSADSGDTGTDDGAGDGAPESYADFTMPEGVVVNEPLMEGFKEWAKKNNLSQEAAQEAVDLQTKTLLEAEQAKADEAKQVVQKWTNELKADPEFGGDKYEENVAIVQRAVRELGGEHVKEIEKVMNQTGLGSYPPFVKMLFAAGKLTSEDSYQSGGQEHTKKDAAEVLYGPTGVRPKQ